MLKNMFTKLFTKTESNGNTNTGNNCDLVRYERPPIYAIPTISSCFQQQLQQQQQQQSSSPASSNTTTTDVASNDVGNSTTNSFLANKSSHNHHHHHHHHKSSSSSSSSTTSTSSTNSSRSSVTLSSNSSSTRGGGGGKLLGNNGPKFNTPNVQQIYIAPHCIRYTNSTLDDTVYRIDDVSLNEIATEILESDSVPPKLQIVFYANKYYAINNSHLQVYKRLQLSGLITHVQADVISVEAIPFALRQHLLQTPSQANHHTSSNKTHNNNNNNTKKHHRTRHHNHHNDHNQNNSDDLDEDDLDDDDVDDVDVMDAEINEVDDEDDNDNDDDDEDEDDNASNSSSLEANNILTAEDILTMPEIHDVLRGCHQHKDFIGGGGGGNGGAKANASAAKTMTTTTVLVDETYEFGACENCLDDDEDEEEDEEEEENGERNKREAFNEIERREIRDILKEELDSQRSKWRKPGDEHKKFETEQELIEYLKKDEEWKKYEQFCTSTLEKSSQSNEKRPSQDNSSELNVSTSKLQHRRRQTTNDLHASEKQQNVKLNLEKDGDDDEGMENSNEVEHLLDSTTSSVKGNSHETKF